MSIKGSSGVAIAALAVLALYQVTDIARGQPVAHGAGETFSGNVTHVVDGDTFWLDSRPVRIRVWGLDAPEVREVGGSAATAAMERLVSGQWLTCLHRDTDRFGRIVAQCFLQDGRDITAAMIQSGTAQEYCRFSRNHYGTC